MFDQIEKLKHQYTDRYVVVIEERTPELKRFAGLTGQVKTVNMNGRALVQFDAYNNVAWYDINLDFLRVVDAPAGKVEVKEEKKAAPVAKTVDKLSVGTSKSDPTPVAGTATSEIKSVVSQVAASSVGATGPAKQSVASKASTAEILAAARAKTAGEISTGGVVAASPAVAKAPPTAQESPTAAAKKPSTADILAAARAKAPISPPTSAVPASVKPKPEPEVTPSAKPTVAAAVKAPVADPIKKPPVVKAESVVKSDQAQGLTTTAEKIEWCKKHDAKG